VDRLPDLDSVGGRAGVYIGAGHNAYLGLGCAGPTWTATRPSTAPATAPTRGDLHRSRSSSSRTSSRNTVPLALEELAGRI
jgi:hypothetical protein